MASPEPRATFCAPTVPAGPSMPHRIHRPEAPSNERSSQSASGPRAQAKRTPEDKRGRRISRWRACLAHRSQATAREATRFPPAPGADVAQLVEQLTRNEQVVRSSRIVGSILAAASQTRRDSTRVMRRALLAVRPSRNRPGGSSPSGPPSSGLCPAASEAGRSEGRRAGEPRKRRDASQLGPGRRSPMPARTSARGKTSERVDRM